MRVTTKAYTDNFLNSNNTLLSNLIKSQNKILTQRRYNRASEDSVSAAKAAHVRKSLSNLDIYDENCETAHDLFYAAEDALYDIANTTYIDVKQKVTSIQDTLSQTELDIVAGELDQLAEHMIQDMNSDFAERQMFGSCSNDKTPFTVYSTVRVFDSEGNEIMVNGNTFGNELDTAFTGDPVANSVIMNDDCFYDSTISELNLPEGTADELPANADEDGVVYTDLYDSAGNKYSVRAKTTYTAQTDDDGNVTGYSISTAIVDSADKEVTPVYPSDVTQTMFMNDDVFYTSGGSKTGQVINLNGGSEALEALYNSADEDPDNPGQVSVDLYDSDGNKYPAKAVITLDDDGSYSYSIKDSISDSDITAIPASSVAYDSETGEKIDAPVDFDGSDYYIVGTYGDPEGQINFHVNGEYDRSGAVSDRIVCYNDIPINLSGDDLLKAVNGGTIVYYDTAGNIAGTKTVDTGCTNTVGDYSAFPGGNPIYVDIGLGINYSKLSETALDVSLNGAQITGYGTDSDGDSYNLIQLVFDAAKALRAGDKDSVNRYIDKLDDANTKVLEKITELGVQQNNLDSQVDRNSIYRLSLQEKQNELEGTDLESEITNWKTIDAAYNAALSMGSKILPNSIFDFI